MRPLPAQFRVRVKFFAARFIAVLAATDFKRILFHSSWNCSFAAPGRECSVGPREMFADKHQTRPINDHPGLSLGDAWQVVGSLPSSTPLRFSCSGELHFGNTYFRV